MKMKINGGSFIDTPYGYWFGDFATESFWEVLYHLGRNSLDELKKIVGDLVVIQAVELLPLK